ncbi:hypothetical protein GCM10020001_014660 [Nonomuraea salmonea]
MARWQPHRGQMAPDEGGETGSPARSQISPPVAVTVLLVPDDVFLLPHVPAALTLERHDPQFFFHEVTPLLPSVRLPPGVPQPGPTER